MGRILDSGSQAFHKILFAELHDLLHADIAAFLEPLGDDPAYFQSGPDARLQRPGCQAVFHLRRKTQFIAFLHSLAVRRIKQLNDPVVALHLVWKPVIKFFLPIDRAILDRDSRTPCHQQKSYS